MLDEFEASPSQVRQSEASRITGSIRALKVGFGFIAGDDGRNYFFHWSALEKTGKSFEQLEMKDQVSFNVVENDRGPRAVSIRVMS